MAIYQEGKSDIEYHYSVSKPKIRQISLADIAKVPVKETPRAASFSDTNSEYSNLKKDRSLKDYSEEQMISPTIKTRPQIVYKYR